jgi:hypothetical protein
VPRSLSRNLIDWRDSPVPGSLKIPRLTARRAEFLAAWLYATDREVPYFNGNHHRDVGTGVAMQEGDSLVEELCRHMLAPAC